MKRLLSLSLSLSRGFFHLSDTLCSPCAGCEICVRKKREAKVTLVDRTFLLCKACALTQQSKAATPALREQTPETDGWDDAVRGAHDLDVWRWIKRRCLRVCRAQSLEAAQSLSLASTADEFGSVLQTHLFIAMSSDPELSTDRMLAGARRIMSDLPTLFAVVNQLFPLADTAISIVGCDVHVLFRIEENWLRLVDRHKLPLPMRAVGAVVPPPPAAADADSSSNSDRERPTTQWHAGDLQKSRSVTISRDNAALKPQQQQQQQQQGPAARRRAAPQPDVHRRRAGARPRAAHSHVCGGPHEAAQRLGEQRRQHRRAAAAARGRLDCCRLGRRCTSCACQGRRVQPLR